MPGVILVLGLIAAGVYTGSWGFYVAAGVLGGLYMLLTLLIAGLMASVKIGVDELNKTGKLKRS